MPTRNTMADHEKFQRQLFLLFKGKREKWTGALKNWSLGAERFVLFQES
jgi:hypothetical protein